MAVIPIKSKGVAYLLWFFLGWLSAHRFYLGKIGSGILYLVTGQFFGIGWIIDGFTLGSKVDIYNALHGGVGGGVNVNQAQNVVVNVAVPQPTPTAPEDTQSKNS
jgi:TM2 domain-containing membrane protein YozV